jgi:two-component sensor histidine kinase
MIKKYRLEILLSIALVIGGIVVQSLLNVYYNSIKKEHQNNLNKVHSDAVLKAQAALDVYTVLVSSLRAYLTNKQEFPTELEYQKYLSDLVKGNNFKDSIVVSYLNKDHVFKYVFDINHIDRIGLKGQSAKDFRPPSEIAKLNKLIQQDAIHIFEPINLQEGWAGLPFNFTAKTSGDESSGYISPLINIKYLLDFFYPNNRSENFVHSFRINDSIDITREAVYDGTTIYNLARDPEYYKKYNIPEEDFIFSKLNVSGLNLTIGSAYKLLPPQHKQIAIITYAWYIILSIFSFLILFQRSKNLKLTQNLKSAYREIGHKNNELEKNIFKVQTLIKEVHHRIKNNMQMIGNLLMLQEDEYNDPKVTKALTETKNRIQSMSLIHEKLYGSSTLEDVNAKQYIEQLIQFVEDTISNEEIKPHKNIEIPSNLTFDAETMSSLGLIINELITNSYKYAFQADNENLLNIVLTIEGDNFILNYSDNGPGLPVDFDLETSNSLGMQLISILTNQLNGSVTYKRTPKFAFIIVFKNAESVH